MVAALKMPDACFSFIRADKDLLWKVTTSACYSKLGVGGFFSSEQKHFTFFTLCKQSTVFILKRRQKRPERRNVS